jgi:glycosyltransferase involved in cell wall biosynthesis
MKRILMIAYHFPPLAGSSGIQRTLRFVQHLPKFGWEPIVLSADPRAYERTSDDLMREIPEGTPVSRAFALDTARHLSLKGRYIAAMARPDRWISWKYAGIREGMRLIKHFKPDVIWSTYPIATAHIIGAELHKQSGIPWVADFRDPMAQENYPPDPVTWRQFEAIERGVMGLASISLFTTPGAADVYRKRYPEASQRIHVLENGYDEESFPEAETEASCQPLNPGKITLLHSGIVYPSERDPTQLFQALAQLKATDSELMSRFRIRFRAAVHDKMLLALANSHGVEANIEVLPSIPYRQALAEMLSADALLVMQASNCNQQIPAKIYEYLRSRKPILGLTDPVGDTAGVLRKAGCTAIAKLDFVPEIYSQLRVLLAGGLANGCFPSAHDEYVIGASRLGRTRSLVEMIEQCCGATT